MNSRSLYGKENKKALHSKNIANASVFLTIMKKYILDLKDIAGKSICESGRKVGFIGFLTCIESIMKLYDILVGESATPVRYLASYRFSQDHLERFFCYVRSHGGHNNNPTAQQFTCAFRKILVHSELYEARTGNSLPLDKINILCVSKKKTPEELINASLPTARMLVDFEEKSAVASDEPMLSSMTTTTDIIVGCGRVH